MGKPGTGNGQFYLPCGIAVNSAGDVFVSDTFHNRVQEFDLSGNYMAQWGSSAPNIGFGSMQFFNPEGIAINSAGSAYVADSGNARIQRFAP